MPKQVELDPSLCSDCPLVQAVNGAWAEFELFSVSSEIDGYKLPGMGEFDGPSEHLRQAISAYEAAMDGYNTVLESLSAFVVSNGCPGRQEGILTGTFCGVEGKLREMGVSVPEY